MIDVSPTEIRHQVSGLEAQFFDTRCNSLAISSGQPAGAIATGKKTSSWPFTSFANPIVVGLRASVS
jgi:hypothetical protein